MQAEPHAALALCYIIIAAGAYARVAVAVAVHFSAHFSSPQPQRHLRPWLGDSGGGGGGNGGGGVKISPA